MKCLDWKKKGSTHASRSKSCSISSASGVSGDRDCKRAPKSLEACVTFGQRLAPSLSIPFDMQPHVRS